MDAREMDIETLKKNIDREWGYRRAEELRVERLRSQTHEEWVWGLDVVHSKVHEPDQNIFRVAAGVQSMLNAKNVTFCFIGGIPLQRWGETRHTNDVNISLGFTPYERRMIERAVDVDYGVGVPLRICCAEDLVITKTLAGRGQDWVDLKRIIQRRRETMDWPLVYGELEPLLAMGETEENTEKNLSRLQEMVANTR